MNYCFGISFNLFTDRRTLIIHVALYLIVWKPKRQLNPTHQQQRKEKQWNESTKEKMLFNYFLIIVTPTICRSLYKWIPFIHIPFSVPQRYGRVSFVTIFSSILYHDPPLGIRALSHIGCSVRPSRKLAFLNGRYGISLAFKLHFVRFPA